MARLTGGHACRRAGYLRLLHHHIEQGGSLHIENLDVLIRLPHRHSRHRFFRHLPCSSDLRRPFPSLTLYCRCPGRSVVAVRRTNGVGHKLPN